MSTLEQRLAGLDRAGGRSLTGQIVELFLEAIASGELAPGTKLPPTRRLAQLAGINQLTASRCYRQLQTLGAVVSEVGRGTFVRAAGATARDAERATDVTWQSYVLPPERIDRSDQIIGEIARHVEDPSVIPLSAGYPSLDLLPLDALRAATRRRSTATAPARSSTARSRASASCARRSPRSAAAAASMTAPTRSSSRRGPARR